MRRLTTVLVTALCLLVAVRSAPAEPRGMTPFDVARLESHTAAEISPDGTRVAVVRSVPRPLLTGDDGPAWAELYLLDVDSGQLRPFVTGEVNVSRVSWLPDGSAVAFLAERGGDEHRCLYAIPVDGGEARRVVCLGDDIRDYAFSPDGRRVAAIAAEPEAEERAELDSEGFDQVVVEEELRPRRVWIVDVGVTDAEPRALPLDGSASRVRWSPTGEELAVAVAPRPLVDDGYMRQRVRVVDPGSGEVRARIDNPGKLDDLRWSPDGRWLAMLSGSSLHDPAAGSLLVVGRAGGEPRDLTEGLEGTVSALAWQDAATILVLADVGVSTRLLRAHVTGGSLEPVAEPFSGGVLTDVSLARDGRTAAALGESPRHPAEVLTGTVGGELARRTVADPWLDEIRLAPQEVVRFQARDGLRLEGILVRPLGTAEDERVPLVLVVHGGPESHYRNGWMTRYSRPAQVLAARGIAVFHPNYRGSTGRGVQFAMSSQGDPAGAEFDDLVDAVDHLIQIGLVDPQRVGVTGGSYGGYATAWLTTRFSDRFAAGVMMAGISDKVSKIGTTDIPEEEFLVHARRRVWDDPLFFLQRSPIFWVADAHTPLLIVHGTADERVDVGQARELYRALETLGGAPVRLVLYPGEGHGNRDAAARYDLCLRLVRWMEHYLAGPGAEPPPPALDYRSERWGWVSSGE